MLILLGFLKLATNGQEAVDAVIVTPLAFHLTLVDISMPILDGLAATKEIKRMGWMGPVIAMTSNALRGDKEQYLAAGMNGYSGKPMKRGHLERELSRCLN